MNLNTITQYPVGHHLTVMTDGPTIRVKTNIGHADDVPAGAIPDRVTGVEVLKISGGNKVTYQLASGLTFAQLERDK